MIRSVLPKTEYHCGRQKKLIIGTSKVKWENLVFLHEEIHPARFWVKIAVAPVAS